MAEPEWSRLNGEAVFRRHAGDFKGAIARLRRAIELAESLPELRGKIGMMHNYLSHCYLLDGSLDEAEVAARRALEYCDVEDEILATYLRKLSDILFRRGKTSEAKLHWNRGYKITRRKLGWWNPYVVQLRRNWREMRRNAA